MPSVNFIYVVSPDELTEVEQCLENIAERYSGCSVSRVDGGADGVLDGKVTDDTVGVFHSQWLEPEPELFAQRHEQDREGDPDCRLSSFTVAAGVVSVNGLAMALSRAFADKDDSLRKSSSEPRPEPLAERVLDEPEIPACPWRVNIRR